MNILYEVIYNKCYLYGYVIYMNMLYVIYMNSYLTVLCYFYESSKDFHSWTNMWRTSIPTSPGGAKRASWITKQKKIYI